MNATTFIATTGSGIARAVRIGDDSWQVETALSDQDVRSLAADPLKPGVVYVGTQNNGLLRSSDGGQTWQPFGLDGQCVKSIAASPTRPGTIYVGLKPPLVFVSHDDGATWGELTGFRRIRWRRLWFSPAEPPFTVGYVQGLALSPTDPNVIVAGIEFGALVRSEDGGQTWSNHITGALRDCHSLVFHATNGSWVYESGGTGAGASFSRDGGRTWTQPREGLDRHYGWSVAADPARPEVWYVSVAPGPQKAHSAAQPAEAYIFRAEGDGPWQKLGGGLPQPFDHMPYALRTDPGAPGHLYAGLDNGDVWHTADYGEHWQQLPFNLGHIERDMIVL